MQYRRTIAITNQKGGVGKTTTAINLASCLAELGQQVLLIDADQQGNTTSGIGLNKNSMCTTIYDVLLSRKTLSEVKQKTMLSGLEVVPANIHLTGAELELMGQERREYRLKDALREVKKDYNYIIIDCPPSLNLITVNALVAADTVLVPVQCEYFALEGLEQLLHAVQLVKERLHPRIDIEGVVFTMYDARTNLSLQVVEQVKKRLPRSLYCSIIPRNVRLGEAPSHGLPIHLYDTKSKGAESYRLLAQQVLEWNQ